jgi:hypothetical protein
VDPAFCSLLQLALYVGHECTVPCISEALAHSAPPTGTELAVQLQSVVWKLKFHMNFMGVVNAEVQRGRLSLCATTALY